MAKVKAKMYLGKVRERHMADYHKKCPVCCRMWTRYWTQSRQFWCSGLHRAANSPPAETNSSQCYLHHRNYKQLHITDTSSVCCGYYIRTVGDGVAEAR